jgi:hypothetical protein
VDVAQAVCKPLQGEEEPQGATSVFVDMGSLDFK